MRILITAQIFHDTSRMGAHRPRAFAQVLAERGHDVTVITRAVPPARRAPDPVGVRVITAGDPTDQVFATGSALPLSTRVLVGLAVLPTAPAALFYSSPSLRRLVGVRSVEAEAKIGTLNKQRYRTANFVKTLVDDRKWVRAALKQSHDTLGPHPSFDVVFSTYGPFGSLWLGRAITRDARTRWVADLRDGFPRGLRPRPLQLWVNCQRRQLLRQADAITVVSSGVRKGLLDGDSAGKNANKVHVVTNGFLHDEETATPPAPVAENSLTVAYTGALYGGRRDLRPLLQAMREVSEQNRVVPLRLHYAGPDGTLLKQLAAEVAADHLVVDHGPVSHTEAVNLQKQADLLLALTWNEPGSEGILSGKFLEYMGQGKPVIALVSGTLPGAEITRMTNEANLGIAVEAAEGGHGQTRLQHFLSEAAEAKAAGRKPSFTPKTAVTAQFDYRAITRRLERLLVG